MQERSHRDAELVQRALAGDGRALEELVAAHQALVASVAWRHGVRPDDVEDVVSEVFVKAYRNLHRFEPTHPFSTWLYRLAVNHVIDHHRRRRREPVRAVMPDRIADPTIGADRELEDRDRAARLREAMAEIRHVYREALVLVYLEGRTVGQAARAMGVPVGTAKTRLMRGREELKRILRRRHPEFFDAL